MGEGTSSSESESINRGLSAWMSGAREEGPISFKKKALSLPNGSFEQSGRRHLFFRIRIHQQMTFSLDVGSS